MLEIDQPSPRSADDSADLLPPDEELKLIQSDGEAVSVTTGGKQLSGKELRYFSGQFSFHGKAFWGNRSGIPPRSIYAKRPTRVSLTSKKIRDQRSLNKGNERYKAQIGKIGI